MIKISGEEARLTKRQFLDSSHSQEVLLMKSNHAKIDNFGFVALGNMCEGDT